MDYSRNQMKTALADLIDADFHYPVLSRAPGRVEILGNHTDYNGGLVLSSTIDRYVYSLGVGADEVHLFSLDFDEEIEFFLGGLSPSGRTEWHDYVRGVYWAMARRGYNVNGIAAVVTGDIPIGAGLSSSAALEVSFVNLIAELNDLHLEPKIKAMIAFEAERIYCAVACGIMDQFTSQLGKENSVLRINCSSLQTRRTPLPADLSLVVTDSKVSRPAGEALNERKSECQEALNLLKKNDWEIANLSSVTPNQLSEASEILDETLMKRVRHVVEENQRVKDGFRALERGNLTRFGELMYASHSSSKSLYEVSHPKLDLLVDIARNAEGVIGSRLTGAGFGGATISIVKSSMAESFADRIKQEYLHETGIEPQVMKCEIPEGATLRRIDV